MTRTVIYAAVILLGVSWHLGRVELFPTKDTPRDLVNCMDFHIYYEAARGNDTWLEDTYPAYLNPKYAQGWLYPSWTRVFWWWTLPLTFEAAKWLWLFAIMCAAGELTYRLINVRGGILVALLVTKAYLWQIETGNADFILALCALSPIGVVLASGIKFPLAVFLGLHAWESKAGGKVLGHASKAT